MRNEIISLVFIEDNDSVLFWNEVQTILYNLVCGIIRKEIEQKVKAISKNGFFIIIKFMKNNSDISSSISSTAIVKHFKEEILNIRYQEKDFSDDFYEVYCFLDKKINIKEKLSSFNNKKNGAIIIIDGDRYNKSKIPLAQESNGKDMFSINVYLDCGIFTSLFNRTIFGHLVINKKLHNNPCYSDKPHLA